VNLPDVPSAEIAGVRITRLARGSHLNTVEEDDTGRQKVYRLVRRRLDTNHADDTDIQAVEQGHISLTPLYFNRVERPEPQILESLREDLLREMNNGW
jgi:5'-nucleotidase